MTTTTKSARALLATLSVLALAACAGGGSGSDAGPVAATPAAPSTPTTPTTPPAQDGRFNPRAGDVFELARGRGVVSVSADAAGKISIDPLTAPNGKITSNGGNAFTLDVPGQGSFALTTDSAGKFGGTFGDKKVSGSFDAGKFATAFATPFSLSYTEFGSWLVEPTGATGTPQAGVFAIGYQTPMFAMPTTGSASYVGGATGQKVSNTDGYQISGEIRATANFANNTISGGLVNMRATDYAGKSLGAFNAITLNGSIYLNNFAGTATAGGGSLVTAGSAGTFAGQFNGTAAAEIGGTWSLTDSANGGVFIGSFGGKK